MHVYWWSKMITDRSLEHKLVVCACRTSIYTQTDAPKLTIAPWMT